jgi:hypothetical protein
MKLMSKTYIEQCLAGDIPMEAIDDFVARFHEDRTIKGRLRDYLGFTYEEYKYWVEDEESLPHIIYARKHGIPLRKAIEAQAVAARSEPTGEGTNVIEPPRKTRHLK